MEILWVDIPPAPYEICVGPNALEEAGEALLALCPHGRAHIVTDENVWPLYGERLQSVLARGGIAHGLTILPPGEGSKTMPTLSRLYGDFLGSGLTRRDPVLAFGGGIVGDTAGFAAATYMRGVPFVQIPTTLLAQVDASIGGKVAVNLPEGKNLAGCFYQPSLVIADTTLLKPLPGREWRSGLGEMVKHGAIGGEPLLSLLEDGLHQAAMEGMIALNCRIKAEYVTADAQDRGRRMMLNFGHTFGHAIERYRGYGTLSHGEAVALGMGLALEAGVRLGITPEGDAARLRALMDGLGLSYRWEEGVNVLLPHMAGDKKNGGEGLNLILLSGIGHPVIHPIRGETLSALFAGEGGVCRG